MNLAPFKRPFSLRKQLFGWLMLLILPVILISAAVGYFLASQYANIAYDKALYRTALALADQVEINGSKIEVNLPQIAKDLLEFDEEDDVYFRIIDAAGDLINTHTALPLPKLFPVSDKHFYYTTQLNDKKLRVVVYCLFLNEANIQSKIYVMVGETLQKRDLMTKEIILGMLIPQLMIVLLVSGLLFFGIARGLRPLTHMQSELTQRQSNDLSPLESTSTPSEIKPLIDGFNALLARVNDNVNKQQRFVSAASHQLKTPLAGLKMQAELALREAEPHKIHHALLQINQASGHLSHLVSQLLSLTKAEPEGAAYATVVPLDLQHLAKEVAAEWVGAALKKNIDLEFISTASSTTIQGNTTLLKEMMNNLIDNAIRYSYVGGKIIVGIQAGDQTLRFFVKDNGAGIRLAEQAYIFERFYRVLDTQEDGCGLGLTIVKEIAERHFASVSCLSEGQHKGAIFTVTFGIEALVKSSD